MPDLEDIVEFGEMVQKADMPSEAVTAAKYIHVPHTYYRIIGTILITNFLSKKGLNYTSGLLSKYIFSLHVIFKHVYIPLHVVQKSEKDLIVILTLCLPSKYSRLINVYS